jgi:beta-galactosidase/beta-glucuronidase
MTAASDLPRPEYPRPQFRRDEWLNLNGPWQFEKDPGDSGHERGLRDRELSGRITVPFCMESELSGIGDRDRCLAVWYRRTVTIPADWADRRVLLHFGAADYETFVWASLDGGEMKEVGRHNGGWSSFDLDLSFALGGEDLAGREVTLCVRCRDDWRVPNPYGKQVRGVHPAGCHYPRTTGIWQTVWLEPVPERTRLGRPFARPDVGRSTIRLTQPIEGDGPGPHADGLTLRATLSDADGEVCQASGDVRDFSPELDLPVPTDRVKLWRPGDPHLYDLRIELLKDGQVVDACDSYTALRSVTLDGKDFRINGEPVFQRLVLDQGYYPDGILTAPSDAALVKDIELSMAAGFNGARLHQKVFEERFLYHADRLGYLCWGEFGDWGADVWRNDGSPDWQHKGHHAGFVTQWLEVLLRDRSHPCIVGWCPLNETRQRRTDRLNNLDDVTVGMALACRATDPTRPVLDASGYSHRVPWADVYDAHDYEQDPRTLAGHHTAEHLAVGGHPIGAGNNKDFPDVSEPYRGQPYFVSEFGGIKVAGDQGDGWGYGKAADDVEAFYARFEGQCRALAGNELHFGYCYTQLTDVFQEVNGIVRFDRSERFDMSRLREIQEKAVAGRTG